MEIELPTGAVTGYGGLPHWDAAAAVADVLRLAPQLPFVPQLPRRSRFEAPLAQAVAGMAGVSIDAAGRVVVDRRRFDPDAPLAPVLDGPAWSTWSVFAEAVVAREGALCWHLCGPLTVAGALAAAGVPWPQALDAAVAAAHERVRALHAVLATAAPAAVQVAVVDEPALAAPHQDGCVGWEPALDAVSSVLATLEGLGAVAGLHAGAGADWSLVLATGPGLLAVPVGAGLAEAGGAVAAHLDRGGWIAWGAVPVEGPLGAAGDRLWRHLGDEWCALVRSGCDPALLRRRAVVMPAGGLAAHGRPQVEHVFGLADRLARRIQDQAMATRFCLGA